MEYYRDFVGDTYSYFGGEASFLNILMDVKQVKCEEENDNDMKESDEMASYLSTIFCLDVHHSILQFHYVTVIEK